MGLLSKIKSALGFGEKVSKSTPKEGQKQGRGAQPPRRNRGPMRSRSAKPRNHQEGDEGLRQGRAEGESSRSRREGTQASHHERSQTSKHSHRREHTPRQGQGPRGDRSERHEHPSQHRQERRNRNDHRDRGDRHERNERRERQNTPANVARPGGAFTAEQLKAYAEAHAAWDVNSYQVPEEEGKKRFIDFGLPSEILHAVSDLGFQYCTPIQAQSLEFSLAGKNLAGRAQTGTGKTAAFLIAVLTRYLRTPEKRNLKPGVPRALILAPTRELVIQICKDAEALGKYCGDVRSLAVYGGMDYDRQRRELEEAPVDLLVATPGRLKDYMRNHIVDLRQVDTLVIDEADRMLDMGFIPDVRAIVNRLPDRDHRCTMLYSATLNETVMNLAAMWMRDPVRVEIESDSLATDTVKQVVYIARAEEKFKLLFNHLAKYSEARTIIFCNRKFTTERISENLRRRGIACEVLSGDVNQVRRLKILEAFRAGKIRTVVATDVAGRGIHVDDISFVVNYDFPYEPEDYVHRIGRTGRAGQTGTAISFADEDESFIIPDIEAYINEPLKCTMPEEWMYAELPEPTPRRKRDRGGENSECGIRNVELKRESETATPEETPSAAPEVSTVEVTPAANNSEFRTPNSEFQPVKPEENAEGGMQNAEAKSESEAATPEVKSEEVKSEEEKSGSRVPNSKFTKKPKSAKRSEFKKPNHTPNPELKKLNSDFKKPNPDLKKSPKRAKNSEFRAPNAEFKKKPMAQRWARTQSDGPRDGSESHHAQPIADRPIYTPGTRGPIADEWTPGQ